MKPFESAAVEEAFAACPPAMRKRLLTLRDLIFKTAASTAGVGEIAETLKWGQPAYVTSQSKSGNTIRIGWRKGNPSPYAVYFNCHTTLVDTFRTLFPREFRYEGNRAIVFNELDIVPTRTLRFCIATALTYQRDKATPVARNPGHGPRR